VVNFVLNFFVLNMGLLFFCCFFFERGSVLVVTHGYTVSVYIGLGEWWPESNIINSLHMMFEKPKNVSMCDF